MFAVDPNTGLPVGSGPKSPILDSGRAPFTWHYVVDFWRRNPNAFDSADHPNRSAPGVENSARFFLTGDPKLRARIPAGARARLDGQMRAAIALIMRNPWMGTPRGMELNFAREYLLERDDRGTEVYGFRLEVRAFPLHLENGSVRDSGGCWHTPRGSEADRLEIASNDYERFRRSEPVGRYLGVQVADFENMALFAAAGRPAFVPAEGRLAPNPAIFDPARPKTDIQVLTVRLAAGSTTVSLLNKGQLHPMSGSAQLAAAAYLTPWNILVSEANARPPAPTP